MFWISLFLFFWFAYIINNFRLAKTTSNWKRDAQKNNYNLYITPKGETKLTSNNHDIIDTNLYGRNVSIDKQTNRIIRDNTLIYSSHNNMVNSIYEQKEKQQFLNEGKRFLLNNKKYIAIIDYDFDEPYTTVGIHDFNFMDLKSNKEVIRVNSNIKYSYVKNYKKLYNEAFSKVDKEIYESAAYLDWKQDYHTKLKKHNKNRLVTSSYTFEDYCREKRDKRLLFDYLYLPHENKVILNKDTYNGKSVEEISIRNAYLSFVNKLLYVHNYFKPLYTNRFKNGKVYYSDAIEISNLTIKFPYLYDEKEIISKLEKKFYDLYLEANWYLMVIKTINKTSNKNKYNKYNSILNHKVNELNILSKSINVNVLISEIKPNKVYKETEHLLIKSQ